MTSPTLTGGSSDSSPSPTSKGVWLGDEELRGVDDAMGGVGLCGLEVDLGGVGLWFGLITCSSCLVSLLVRLNVRRVGIA